MFADNRSLAGPGNKRFLGEVGIGGRRSLEVEEIRVKHAQVLRETLGQLILGQYIENVRCLEGFELAKIGCSEEGSGKSKGDGNLRP